MPARQILLSSGAPASRRNSVSFSQCLQQIGDRLAQARVRLDSSVPRTALQPLVQLLHHRPAVLLVEVQRSSATGPARAPAHRSDRPRPAFPARTGTLRESSPSLPQTAAGRGPGSWPAGSLRRRSFGTLRDSASHIWIGGGRSAGRCLSTSARFSPACCRPVKYSAIRRCLDDPYDPAGEHAGPLLGEVARPVQRQHAHRRIVVVQHFALRRLADQFLAAPAGSMPRFPRPDLPLRGCRQRDAQVVLPAFQPIQGNPAAVLAAARSSPPPSRRISSRPRLPAPRAVNTSPHRLQRSRSSSYTVAASGACPMIRTSTPGSRCG